MKESRWKFAVTFTTSFVIVYHMSPFLGFSDNFIIAMFITSPILVLWMAYNVLRFGVESTKKFDDGYYYDDLDKVA